MPVPSGAAVPVTQLFSLCRLNPRMKTLNQRFLAATVLVLAAATARAQVIDDLDWRREGSDGVLQISFSVPIQFLRAATAASGDLTQAFYEIRPTRELPRLTVSERRLEPSDGLPGVRVVDEAVLSDLSRKLVIRFDRPINFRVRAGRGNCCIDVVIVGAGAAVDARTAPEPARSASDRFQITLQRSTDPGLRMETPVPGALQNYQVFTARRVVNGVVQYEINLGFFQTREEAERALRQLTPRFPLAAVVDLSPLPPPSAVAAVREAPAAPAPRPAAPAASPAVPLPAVPLPPLPAPSLPSIPSVTPSARPAPAAPPAPVTAQPPAAPSTPLTAPPATPAASATAPAVAPAPRVTAPGAPAAPAAATAAVPPAAAEIDARGQALLAQGRAEFSRGAFEQSVATFNQLLNLPPNSASRDAQELIGIARARAGDVARARAEFDLYLRLYPNEPGAQRVRAELAKLGTAPAALTAAERRARAAPPPREPITTVTGSVSQYYFGGRSQVTTLLKDTPLEGVPQVISSQSISDVDQSQLANSFDFNYRRRSADGDLRLVFRDTYTHNFLDQKTTQTRKPNRLTAAYLDYKSIGPGWSTRLGRQSATGGGVLGRFDGARLGYSLAPKFSLNAVVGTPSEDLFDTKRHFYGMSFDAENLGDHLSASLYGIQQMVDDEVDRRAIGTELRYFDTNASVFSILDYDTLYQAVNIGSLQGSWTTFGNSTTFTLLADRRTAPILSTANALLRADDSTTPPTIYRSMSQILAVRTIDEVRQLAKATTTYVKQGLLGMSVQATPNFQFGLDARLTNVGPLPAFETIPAQPGSGNVVSYGVQSILSNLYSQRDAHVLNFTYINAPTYSGRLIAYNNLSLLWQNIQIEPSIKYYSQEDMAGVQIDRLTPGLRITWRLGPRFSIESDASFERSKTVSATVSDTSNRVFYFIGYRYDY